MSKPSRLSVEEIDKIIEDYKHNKEPMKVIGKRYEVCKETIRKHLGGMIVKRRANNVVQNVGVTINFDDKINAFISKQRKVKSTFDLIKVGEHITAHIQDPEAIRKKYIKISGEVLQKTSNLIVIKSKNRVHSINKADMLTGSAVIAV